MLRSLVYGPDSLTEVLFEEPIEILKPDGTIKFKNKKRRVIGNKNKTSGTIKIGHSGIQSETFFPHIQKVPN